MKVTNSLELEEHDKNEHFASELKPWNSRKTLLKENFFHYVDMTAWSGWRFTLRSQFQKKVSCKFQKLKELINRL